MKSIFTLFKRLFWKYAIGIAFKIFSRDVNIAGLPGKVKILPVVWKNKLHILGLNGNVNFISLEFVDADTVRLISAPEVPPAPSHPLESLPSANRAAHIILCHLQAPQTKGLLEHSRKMSEHYDLILAYGGNRDEFDKIDYDKKIYISDPSLRGSLTNINYNELLKSLVTYFSEEHPDWIFIGDYDTIPLRHNYLDYSIAKAREHKSSFIATSIRDVTYSSCPFVSEAARNHRLGWCADNRLNRDIRVYHCFGAAILFSWDCLQDMLKYLERFSQDCFETALPTAAALSGHQLLGINNCCSEWAKIRYRPFYEISDLNRLQAEGVSLVHPIKDIDDFLRLAGTLQNEALVAHHQNKLK